MHYKRFLLTGVSILFILLLSISLSACKSISIDESANGKEVRISPSTSLKVTLESNPTTGFEWELVQISDANVLEKSSNKYVGDFHLFGSGMVGAGGKEVWTFKALEKGHSTLYMEYSQPWDKGSKGAEKFSLTVVVE